MLGQSDSAARGRRRNNRGCLQDYRKEYATSLPVRMFAEMSGRIPRSSGGNEVSCRLIPDGIMMLEPLYTGYGMKLLHEDQLLRLAKRSGIQPVEIDTGSKMLCIQGDGVFARLLRLIHQALNLPPQQVKYLQRHLRS